MEVRKGIAYGLSLEIARDMISGSLKGRVEMFYTAHFQAIEELGGVEGITSEAMYARTLELLPQDDRVEVLRAMEKFGDIVQQIFTAGVG
jgi:hypothetical protein